MRSLAVAHAYAPAFARRVTTLLERRGTIRRHGDGLLEVSSQYDDHGNPLAGWKRARHVGEYVAAHADEGEWLVERDPAGVVPAYWVRAPGGVVASTDPDLLLPVAVDLELNRDAAIDLVTRRALMDPTATLVRGIRRIPAGYRLRTRDGGSLESTYMRPPVEPVWRQGHRVVDEFWDRFCQAVADRADGDVVVMLSGGLDSSAIAAALAEVHGPERVLAVTFSHDGSDDAEFAQMTARYLGIEWRQLSAGYRVFHRWPSRRAFPECAIDDSTRDLHHAAPGRPVFYGAGGDLSMQGDWDFWPGRMRRGEVGRAAGDFLRTTLLHGLKPGLRAALKKRGAPPPPKTFTPPLQADLTPAIGRRLAQTHRTLASWRSGVDAFGTAAQSMVLEGIQSSERNAPFFTAPFLDTRVVEFVATVPSAPWFIEKELLRAALRGRVPESVRTRPKTPAGWPSTRPLDDETKEVVSAPLRDASERSLIDVRACLDWLDRRELGVSDIDLLLQAGCICRASTLRETQTPLRDLSA